MTLSHVHSRPRMPDRVVLLGSSGFLGRGLAGSGQSTDGAVRAYLASPPSGFCGLARGGSGQPVIFSGEEM